MSLPIAIVASGNGTNAQAMIDLMKAGVLDVDIRLIFCNRPGSRSGTRQESRCSLQDAGPHKVPGQSFL